MIAPHDNDTTQEPTMMRSELEAGAVYARHHPANTTFYAALIVDAAHLWGRGYIAVEGYEWERHVLHPSHATRISVDTGYDRSLPSTGVPAIFIRGHGTRPGNDRGRILQDLWGALPPPPAPGDDIAETRALAYAWHRDHIPAGFQLKLIDPRWLVSRWEDRNTSRRTTLPTSPWSTP
jgi:hypothetical protein